MLVRTKHIILFFSVFFFVSVVKAQYLGGQQDGYSSGYVCGTDLNGSAAALTLGALTGPATFCNNNADYYKVAVTAGSATSYSWSLPTGATVQSGAASNSATVLFATTSGSVTVVASNGCGESATASIAVSNVACSMFSGLDNDGYSSNYVCASDLNGGAAALTIGTLNGPANFCNNNFEAYSIAISTGAATSYSWSFPSGASVQSGGTNGNVTVLFGTTSGSITVVVSNGCGESQTASIAVTNVACNMFNGLSNDGYASAYICGSDLNGVISGTLSLAALTGFNTVCDGDIADYSSSISSGVATSYTWLLPTGASVVSGGTALNARVLFASSSGTVSLTAENGCGESSTTSVAVTNNACSLYAGLNNDGFALQTSCNTDLNGSALALAPLVSYTVSCPGASGTIITLDATGANNFDYAETSVAAFSYVGTYTNTPVQKTVPNGGTYDIQIKTSAGCTDDIFGILTTATPTAIPSASVVGTCQVPGTNVWMYVVDASGNAIVAIDDNSTSLGNVTATVYIDGSVGTYNGLAYLQRHFLVTTGNPPGGSGANVRLYFTATELSNLITASAATTTADDNVSTIANVGVTKYNGPTEDGVYDPTNATSLSFITQSGNGSQFGNNYIEFNTPSFSELWPHGSSNSSPLPIELLFFKGEDKESYNFLEWATASEVNNDYFVIERSLDGIVFEGIGFIKGAGTSSSENHYSFKDFSPFTPISYYRLKQVDFDGKFSISNIVPIHRQNKILRMIVYPTLVKGNENIIIKTNTDSNDILKVEIINTMGSSIHTKEFMVADNQSLLSFSLPNVAPGVYMVTVTQNGVVAKEKITVY